MPLFPQKPYLTTRSKIGYCILTWQGKYHDQEGGISQGDAPPLHSECADPCDFLKCVKETQLHNLWLWGTAFVLSPLKKNRKNIK